MEKLENQLLMYVVQDRWCMLSKPSLFLFCYIIVSSENLTKSDEGCPPILTKFVHHFVRKFSRFHHQKSASPTKTITALPTDKLSLQQQKHRFSNKKTYLQQQKNRFSNKKTYLQQQKSRFSNKKHLSNEEKCHVHECMCERENIDWIVELLIISNHKKHLTNKGKLIVYDSSEKTAIWSLSC